MSWFSDQGLAAHVYQPRMESDVWTPRGGHLMALGKSLTQYSHTLTTLGGYDRCGMTIASSVLGMDDWLQNGIGRHIEVWSSTEEIVWEGFVDSLTLTYGPLTVKVGTLLGIVNRGRVIYQVLDTSTRPPVAGERTRTAWSDNVASQEKYGINVSQLSAGAVTATQAAQLLDAWTAETAEPVVGHQVALRADGSGEPSITEPSITLACRGYQTRLNYPYNQYSTTGDANISTKLGNILDADPNGMFSSTNARITTNTVQVSCYENEDRIAWDIVKELVGLGDAAYARYVCRVGSGQRVVYEAAPTTVEYHLRMAAGEKRITTVGDVPIQPWDVRPGRWLMFPDLLPGRLGVTDLYTDPRAMFIEQVVFTAPTGVALTGCRTYSSQLILAQYGLGGM